MTSTKRLDSGLSAFAEPRNDGDGGGALMYWTPMARYDCIAVYIMASKPNGTLYLGVTSDLLQRGHQHREGLIEGFSAKYGCKLLVWWEQHEQMHTALSREKEIKKWRRAWKLNLIRKGNPVWRDLYEDFLNPPPLPKYGE